MPDKIVAVAIITNQEGKVLLQKRNDPSTPKAHGKWDTPGGGVDEGETKEEAVVRECKEEIGVDVVVIKELEAQFRSWTHESGKVVSYGIYGYHCRIKDNQTPFAANDEVFEVRWFTKEEIEKLETLPGIIDFVNQI